MTAAQGKALLDALPDRSRTVAIVAISTGMRIGELLALRPEDFHRDTMTISVTKSAALVAEGGSSRVADRRVKSTKTKSGRREVPLFPGVADAVDDHIARFGVSPEGYLFTSERSPHSWLTYRAFWGSGGDPRRLQEQDPDFPTVKTHDLRKTFGSWMVANPNVTPMETARVLGHKNVAMTLDIYAQEIDGRSAIPAAQAEMANLFGLNGSKALPDGEIIDAEIIETATVCAECGIPMPTWPKGWRFDDDSAWCPDCSVKEVPMRLFVYEPGEPGYISASFAMADETWREIERRGLSGRGESGVPAMSKHGRLLRRDQVPWEVLAEWESGDDSAFLAAAPVLRLV